MFDQGLSISGAPREEPGADLREACDESRVLQKFQDDADSFEHWKRNGAEGSRWPRALKNKVMTNRKLEALRNLAERPGTEAEGELAKEILIRLESQDSFLDKPADERERWMSFSDFLRSNISTEEFLEKMRRWNQQRRDEPLPETWTCPCQVTIAVGLKCGNTMGHLAIQQAIREKFSKGDRVFYNRWAYPPNCPGRVAAYVKLCAPNGDYPWAWLSVKFDHLARARQVPVYSAEGWNLSHDPINTGMIPGGGNLGNSGHAG